MARSVLLLLALSGIVSSQVVPSGYHLDLQPYPGDGVFKGRVRIDLVRTNKDNFEGIRRIELQAAPGLNVVDREVLITRLIDSDSSEEEELEIEQVDISVSKIERKNHSYILHLSDDLQPDTTYQLDLQFDGTLGEEPSQPFFQGSYIDQASEEERWFVGLNMKPHTSHHVFPCFDQLSEKTWIELSVAHKVEYLALSTMPIIDTTNVTTEGVWVKQHFTRTPPLSLSSLALFISEFPLPAKDNSLVFDGIRTAVWGRQDFVTALTKSQQLLPNIMVPLELYLSRPYPLPQLNLVALPGFTDDTPINSWGLQISKESELMNGNTFWMAHRLAKAATLQWFLHLTTPECCSCVPHGLANFLATIVAKQLVPNNFYDWHLSAVQTHLYETGKPSRTYMNSHQKKELCYFSVENFLSMINQVLSPHSFKTGIQNFLAKKEFKMYREDDIWAALTEQAHLDRTLNRSMNVGEIARSWLDTNRLPVVTVTRNYEKDTVVIHQEPFINQLEFRWTPAKVVKKPSPPAPLWWIPLVVLREPESGDLVADFPTSPAAWLLPDVSVVVLQGYKQDKKYILVNPATIGTFLVNYDQENWRLLTSRVTTMPETIRTQLLHDSFSLALAGQLQFTIALNMTVFLQREQSPTVWRTFYPLADRMRKQFQGTLAATYLDDYIQVLVAPVLEALGEETDKSPAWRTDLRTKTRYLLCSTGLPACVEHAQTHYLRWLKSPNPDSGMPLAGSLLCAVFAHGTTEEWEFGMERLLNFPANRSAAERTFLLKTLAGCSRLPEQYEKILNVTLLGDIMNDTFSEAEKFSSLTAMSGDVTGCTALLNFLSENWKVLKKRLSVNLWEFMIQVSMGRFRSEEGLKRVTELLRERKGQFGPAERAAEEAVETVRSQVQWAKDNEAPVQTWLTQTLSKIWPSQRFKFQDVLVMARTRKFG